MANTAQINTNILYDNFLQQQKRFQLEQLQDESAQRFPNAKALQYKNDPGSSAPAGPYVHGGGGLLSDPGQDPLMFSAMVMAESGMANYMLVKREQVVNPDYGGYDVPYITTITGVTEGDDAWEDQPEEVCDDAPIGGLLKACTFTSPYGRYSKGIKIIDRTRVGHLNNIGETANFNVQNGMMAEDPFTPSGIPKTGGQWINREFTVRAFESAVGFQRMMLGQAYTGNPTNNSAGQGRMQFMGFDLLYNTGKRDVFTSALCPGMDSLIIDWGSVNINEANASGIYFYQMIEQAFRYLRTLAETTGLAPAELVLSMRRDLFFTLSDTIPVQRYLQVIATMNNIVGTDNGAHLTFDGSGIDAMRQEMRLNFYLPIDGQRVKVIVDDGIAETSGSPSTEYVSDVYIHCMSVRGGIPVLYWNYFNFDNNQGREIDAMTGGIMSTSDNGKFAWASRFRNWCYESQWVIMPRIIQHVPFLCGRIENVAYQPLIHTRDWNPNDANYYNGGKTNGTILTGYPAWSPTTKTNLGIFD